MSHSPSPTAEAEDINESVNADTHGLHEGQNNPLDRLQGKRTILPLLD